MVASHSYGWYLRVVVTSVPLGTRQHCALVAYLKARFPRPVFFPAISQPLRGSCMAGYGNLMPTASVAQKRVEECTNRSTAISLPFLIFNFSSLSNYSSLVYTNNPFTNNELSELNELLRVAIRLIRLIRCFYKTILFSYLPALLSQNHRSAEVFYFTSSTPLLLYSLSLLPL